MTSQNLPWQRAWITGAGRGIGRALALQLCAQGVSVYASARNEAELQSLAAETKNLPGLIICCPLDIQDKAAIEALTAQWQSANTFPQLCVFNAGTHDPFGAEEFSAERVEKLLNVNLSGTLRCLDPVLKHYLAAGQGQIAVMASVAGYRGLPTAAAYGAGKAALIHLCEALRLDLIGTGVKLQVVNPGFVRTPLTDKNDFQMPALLEPEDAAERILKGLLSERFEITFPKRFVYWLKLFRMLPYAWYFPLVHKFIGADTKTGDKPHG